MQYMWISAFRGEGFESLGLWFIEMALWVKELAIKPDDLNLTHGTHKQV